MIKVGPEVIGKQVRCLRAHPYRDMRNRQPIGIIREYTAMTAQILFTDSLYPEYGLTWWYMTQDLDGYNDD